MTEHNRTDYSETRAIETMHRLLLEALRHREQEVLRYLAILVPAVGGFIWLLYSDTGDKGALTVGTVGVLLLLLLGAIYSLALGYNYRYIVLQLAKLEAYLNITSAMLNGWPKDRERFVKDYGFWGRMPWCAPPEVIRVFWLAFLAGIVGVMITASTNRPESLLLCVVYLAGFPCLLIGALAPIHFGRKLRKLCEQETKSWKPNASKASKDGAKGDMEET